MEQPAGPSSPPGTSPRRACSPTELDRWATAERTMVVARWVGVAFGLFQVATYGAVPYPPGVERSAYLLIAALVVSNVAAIVWLRRLRTAAEARVLATATLVLDVAIVCAFVWLYAFDDSSLFFLLFFVLPAEAAVKFQLRGAMSAWAVCTAAYVGRDFWAEDRFGYATNLSSASYRMGFLLIVALVFGSFARRLAERTGELEEALRHLEAEDRWRSVLIDMLAHDLRSPVGTATSVLETLKERAEQFDADQTRLLATAAARQNRKALDLADDILTMARARQEQLTIRSEQIALVPFLERLAAELPGGQQDLAIEVDPDLNVHADPRRLAQIMNNLLSNARRHGLPPVTVTAGAGPDGSVSLHVVDSGEGVAPEYQATLFEPFSVGPRADSVGLGLWLVRTLTEAHGGRVGYSVLDGRPSFDVLLPPPPAPAPARSPRWRRGTDPGGRGFTTRSRSRSPSRLR